MNFDNQKGPVSVKINNRKILLGLAQFCGGEEKLIDLTIAIDKLDKIGEDGVKKEMLEKGISEIALMKVQPLFSFTGTIQEKLEKLLHIVIKILLDLKLYLNLKNLL